MASTISRGIKTQQGNPKRCQRVCSFVVSANTHTHTHKSSKAGMRSGFGSCMCIRAFIAKWLLPCLKLCTILGRQSCRHSRRMQNAALTKDVQRQRSSLEPKPAQRREGWRKSSNSVSVLRGAKKGHYQRSPDLSWSFPGMVASNRRNTRPNSGTKVIVPNIIDRPNICV